MPPVNSDASQQLPRDQQQMITIKNERDLQHEKQVKLEEIHYKCYVCISSHILLNCCRRLPKK